MITLQKAISKSGFCSRRNAEQIIKNKKVKINGTIAELGDKVDLKKDKIKINDKLIKIPSGRIYYIVNKPVGYICTTSDKFAKKKITDLVPKNPKVWPVGRLDKNSRGLVILTNDGELTHKLTHPSFKHEKEYLVQINKNINDNLLNRFKKGIKLKEGLARADRIKKINSIKLSIVLHQGWKRQIRRMIHKCGFKVVDLKRIRIGEIKLKNLKEGSWKRVRNLKY